MVAKVPAGRECDNGQVQRMTEALSGSDRSGGNGLRTQF